MQLYIKCTTAQIVRAITLQKVVGCLNPVLVRYKYLNQNVTIQIPIHADVLANNHVCLYRDIKCSEQKRPLDVIVVIKKNILETGIYRNALNPEIHMPFVHLRNNSSQFAS